MTFGDCYSLCYDWCIFYLHKVFEINSNKKSVKRKFRQKICQNFWVSIFFIFCHGYFHAFSENKWIIFYLKIIPITIFVDSYDIFKWLNSTVVWNRSEPGYEMTFQFQSFSFNRVSKRISSSVKSFLLWKK